MGGAGYECRCPVGYKGINCEGIKTTKRVFSISNTVGPVYNVPVLSGHLY